MVSHNMYQTIFFYLGITNYKNLDPPLQESKLQLQLKTFAIIHAIPSSGKKEE